jgi:hypothetical protein
MGILDLLRGVKRPAEGAATSSKDELQQRLLGMNAEQVPFSIKPSQESDLEAEWKIVDASWYEIFAKAGLSKSHKIYLRLDEAKHEVRALEESWEVNWQAGVPKLSLSAQKFQGRTLGSKEFGKGYAFTGINPLSFGEAYNYRFDVSEMKNPIIEIVTSSGWTWMPVTTKGKVRTG